MIQNKPDTSNIKHYNIHVFGELEDKNKYLKKKKKSDDFKKLMKEINPQIQENLANSKENTKNIYIPRNITDN